VPYTYFIDVTGKERFCVPPVSVPSAKDCSVHPTAL